MYTKEMLESIKKVEESRPARLAAVLAALGVIIFLCVRNDRKVRG